MKRLASLVLALIIGSASFALADEDQEAKDCARARKAGRACTITFNEGDRMTGRRPTADGSEVTVIQPLVWSSLIKVRTTFRPEIVRAAENL